MTAMNLAIGQKVKVLRQSNAIDISQFQWFPAKTDGNEEKISNLVTKQVAALGECREVDYQHNETLLR